ncbi:hypothetical protein AGMMS49941_13500 [Deferribacterales bacterium]|nr:hypothetical protein AGMMS49941_13500 [Deferribacterales bacterium]
MQLALDAGARVVGINNRDLKTFQVDLGLTSRLRNLIPAGIITVSESGVKTPADIHTLAASGIDGVLVGEALMRVADKRKFLEEAVCCA